MQYSPGIETMARRYSLTEKQKHLTYLYLKAQKADFGEMQLIVNGISVWLRKAVISPDPERAGHWCALQALPVQRKENSHLAHIYAVSVSANGPTEAEAAEVLYRRLKMVCVKEGWGLAGDVGLTP